MSQHKITICMHTTEYNEHLLHCANLSCMVDNRKYLNEEISNYTSKQSFYKLHFNKGRKRFYKFC